MKYRTGKMCEVFMGKFFTLIELLVVVSILGILISLLLPSLGKARATARQAICLSNMKQTGVAAYTYGKDNKQYMPVWKDGLRYNDHGYRVLLPKYLGFGGVADNNTIWYNNSGDDALAYRAWQKSVWKCPDAEIMVGHDLVRSIAMNGIAVWSSQSSTKYLNSIDSATNPSRSLMFTCSGSFQSVSWNFTRHEVRPGGAVPYMPHKPKGQWYTNPWGNSPIYKGNGIMVYYDGHAKIRNYSHFSFNGNPFNNPGTASQAYDDYRAFWFGD